MNIINLSVPAGVSSPVSECGAVMIGYVGEGGVTKVTLDFSAWAQAYGDGVVTLGVQRSGDPTWYPVALTVDGTTAAWLVAKTDTAVEGMGVARFAYTVGGAEKRSAVWQFFVDRGLQSPEGDAPDPYESWVETLTGLGAETLQNAQDAQEAADAAEQSATDAAGSAEGAETAKNAAGDAAAAAGESARAAGENASTAQGAAQAAQNAAGAAEQSATDAEAAQQAAETAVTHYPKIVNDFWWVWDAERGEYVNTNVKAKGEDGEGAVSSVNGQTGAVELDAEDVGALPDSSTLDDIPDGSTYKRPTAAQLQQIATNAADIQTQSGEIDQLQTDVDAVEQKIPNQASSSNQLADKAFVNSSINSAAAFFRGAFPTRAALFAVAWQTTDPQAENFVSNNDYAYVADDETHNDEAWRYIYVLQPGGTGNGWQPQFRVNETPLTAAQLAAINSGATAELIAQITVNETAIQGKQPTITASGILKGSGNGQVSAAVAGTDYATPAQVNAKYTKPSTGIPKTDLSQEVQTSLGKADTALQAVPDAYRTAAAQDVIDEAQNAEIADLKSAINAKPDIMDAVLWRPPVNFGKKVNGVVGDNIKVYRSWADDKLVFLGSGEMYDGTAYNDPYLINNICGATNHTVREIYIQEGITTIGSHVFNRFYAAVNSYAAYEYWANVVTKDDPAPLGFTLGTLVLPSTITMMSLRAFQYHSSNMQKLIILSSGALTISGDVFQGSSFYDISIPNATEIYVGNAIAFEFGSLRYFSVGGTLMSNIKFTSTVLTNDSLINIANHLLNVVGTETSRTLTLASAVKTTIASLMGTVADDEFTASSSGTVSLQDFITTNRGWSIA